MIYRIDKVLDEGTGETFDQLAWDGEEMKCPMCGSKNIIVLDSRDRGEGKMRRRECVDCWCRFQTMETIVPEKTYMPGEKKGEDKR